MPLFRRRQRFSVRADPAAPALESAPVHESETDWADIENIRREWPRSNVDLDADLLCWRIGMRMADEDAVRAQRFNEAEFITRALRHHIHGGGPLAPADVRESARRVIVLIDGTPDHILQMTHELVPRILRLAIGVVREHGWQPRQYGGDGRLGIPLDTPLLAAAVACTAAADGHYLAHFFGSGPSQP